MPELIRITGVPAVARKLETMPRVIVLGAFAKALEAAAQVIAAELAARTPEADEGSRDENEAHLIEGLTFEVGLNAEGRGGRARVGYGKQGQKAMWVEYGHRLIGHKPGNKQIGEVAAHPFMRPAADAAAEPAVEAFQNTLASELKEMP